MFKLLSRFATKNKKLLSILFLFLVIGGLIIPQISYADWNPVCWEWLWGKTTPATFRGDYCYFSGENNKAVLDTAGDVVKFTFSGVVLAISTIIVGAFGSLAVLASQLFTTVLGLSSNTTMCYTCFSNPAISNGWPLVRDLANMIIVLGFVVIGIATALRIQTYKATKLLPKLIMVAILINFSLLICGIFIDASNIAMSNFMKGGGYLATTAVGNISNQASAIWKNWNMNNATATVGTAVGIAFYDVILFVVFMLYACLFLFRYIALWILVILSPIAFVCFIFPFTNKYFDMWWSNFLGWCIIGIPGGLFMFISDKIASNFGTDAAASTGGTNLLGYIVPCFFLAAGFLISLQTSAMGASAVIGLAKGAGGYAMGAGVGGGKMLGKGLDKATGGIVSSGYQKASSSIGRTMERLGLKQVGSTDMTNDKVVEEKAKGYSAAFAAAKSRGDTATMDKIREKARTGRGSDGAAALQAITDNKDIHNTFKDRNGNFDAAAASSRISYAQSAGASGIRDKAMKQAPTIEAHNGSTLAQIRHDHPGWSTDQVRQEAVVRAASKVSEEELDRNFVNSMDAQTLRAVTGRMTNKKRETLVRNNLDSVQQEREAIAPNRAARQALSPEDRNKWRELAEKERVLRRVA